MLRVLYITACFGLCATVSVQAVDAAATAATKATPQQWLQRMDQAFERYNYDGSFSYFTGADLASLRVVHMVIDGVQRERLVHLNGAPREIVRHGEDVSCIVMPGDDLLDMEVSMPAGPFARAYVRQFDNIAASYSLSLFGTDRVAGRSAVRLAVAPRDAHRFGYRLWLDEETALLLRSELIDGEGKPLEIFQFTNITVGSEVQAQALEPQTDATGMVSHMTLASNRSVSKTAPAVRWHAGWVPSGFIMAASEERRKNSNRSREYFGLQRWRCGVLGVCRKYARRWCVSYGVTQRWYRCRNIFAHVGRC